MCPGADGFVSIHPARTNNPDGWFLLFHYPGLNTAGMRAQQPVRIFIDIKCVLHIPRRMILAQVECGEIMPVVFYFGSFCDGKSKSSEDLYNAVSHNADRMTRTDGNGITGETPILFVGGWSRIGAGAVGGFLYAFVF